MPANKLEFELAMYCLLTQGLCKVIWTIRPINPACTWSNAGMIVLNIFLLVLTWNVLILLLKYSIQLTHNVIDFVR